MSSALEENTATKLLEISLWILTESIYPSPGLFFPSITSSVDKNLLFLVSFKFKIVPIKKISHMI